MRVLFLGKFGHVYHNGRHGLGRSDHDLESPLSPANTSGIPVPIAVAAAHLLARAPNALVRRTVGVPVKRVASATRSRGCKGRGSDRTWEPSRASTDRAVFPAAGISLLRLNVTDATIGQLKATLDKIDRKPLHVSGEIGPEA